LLLGASCAVPGALHAAALSLDNLPLFLGTSSKPNILFVIDDSGSMDWEVMTSDYANGGLFTATQPNGSNPGGAGSVKQRDSNESGSANCGFASGTFFGYSYGVEFASNTYTDDSNDCNTADDEAWRFRNSDFNPMYFNPNINYQPWSGRNADGQPFGNIDITDAPDNPYLPAAQQRRIDLTRDNSNWIGGFNNRTTSDRDGDGQPDGFRYYTWSDLNGNGNFDDGEQTEVQIKNAPPSVQQNFANWFSYYRNREYVAKAAYGQLIAQANNVRMGLVTIHNNNGVNTAIADMNADPASGNKRTLLDNLYSIQSSGGTPLRANLDAAGRYLSSQSNGLFASSPALSAEDGGMCQQNFAVLMTDGFYNGPYYSTWFPGWYWLGAWYPSVVNDDGDNNTSFDGGAYADTRSATLGDIAMHFYETDIQPGLTDSVPTIPGVDEASHQHMVTYGVALGVVGNLSAMPADPDTAFAWPDPFSGSTAQQNAARIDDLRHAAYNGRGKFLSAQDPQGLIDALNNALADIGDRVGSAASVALNSASLNTETTLYQARFDTSDWSGQLLAFPINSDGSIAALAWDAGSVLNTQDWDTGRTIVTYNSTTNQGAAFRWNAIDAGAQAALDDDPTTGLVDNDGEGAARLDYLRGDTSNVSGGNGYRTRSSKLGDLVHSSPFFVGAPAFPYPDSLETAPYSAFRASLKNREHMVYVGANDGMLHGFDANTGAEKLAYVPRLVYANLSRLTDPGYTHRFYVDGAPTVGDAVVNGGWKSVLVGGLRGGGQGVYALDVSDPANFNETNADNLVLWEFDDSNDPDIGYVYGQISIVRMANGQWAAIFGNGYNNSEADGNASSTGHAALFILFIEQGVDGTWTPTSDYIKIDTGVGSTATPNGLATPAPVDINGDSVVDFVYAGDLQGNLWKFDLRGTNTAAWGVAYQTGGTPLPLFTACTASPCTSSNRQPITVRPEITRHPAGEKGFMVYFGTGKYIETGDNATSGEPTQTFYGIWDKDEATLTQFDRSHLLEQRIEQEINQSFDTDGNGTPDTSLI